MASAEPQGWYEDPFRLHEARYFSAGRPTKLVRDGRVESYDEPPGEGVPAGEGVPGSGAAASSGHAVTGTLNRAEAREATDPNSSGDDVPAYPRRRARPGVLTAVAVVAIAGVATGVIANKPRPTVPVTEAMAYTATMNAGSADVYTTYAVTTGTHKFDSTATESGPVSWSADQGELGMKVTLSGQQLMTARQIIDGSQTYSKLFVTGTPASAIAGLPGLTGWSETTWTGVPSQEMSGILPSLLLWGGLFNPAGMVSPASLLGLLNAQASSVQNLGSDVVNGVGTTHYRALIPLSDLGAGTAEEQAQAQQILGTSSIGVDYWIDSSHLLRQLRLALTILQQPSDTTSSPGEVTTPPGTFPITMSVSLGLSHYGTPVHVVPPAPAQITSHVACVLSNNGFNCTS